MAIGRAPRFTSASPADADASPQIVALARRDAQRLAGATPQQMAALTVQGLQVVRVTGSAGPTEAAALTAAGVQIELLESLAP